MKISCIIVDDEPLAQKLMKDNVASVDGLELKGVFSNVKKAKEFLFSETVDVLFLDIQMPGITGIEFAKTISDDQLIIFTTAYEKYAIDGFDLNAVDYLLKPISKERFQKSCDKLMEIFRWKKNRNDNIYFFIHSEHKLIKVHFADILFIEGLKDYVKINVQSETKPILTRMNLKTIQALLTNDFIRIHKSYIINKNHMKSISAGKVIVGAKEIPLGESYKTALRSIL